MSKVITIAVDAMAAGGGKTGSRAVRDSSGKIRVVGGL